MLLGTSLYCRKGTKLHSPKNLSLLSLEAEEQTGFPWGSVLKKRLLSTQEGDLPKPPLSLLGLWDGGPGQKHAIRVQHVFDQWILRG